MKTLILDNKQIAEKINRLAYQIYEANYQEDAVVLVGILPNGATLVQMLASKITEISDIQIVLMDLQIDKSNPSEILFSEKHAEILKNRSVILVDDVLNSGKTMIYGIKYLLDFPIKKLKTLALVDRDHKNYPIHADYVGLSLSTNLQEHVEVVLDNDKTAAYLL